MFLNYITQTGYLQEKNPELLLNEHQYLTQSIGEYPKIKGRLCKRSLRILLHF